MNYWIHKLAKQQADAVTGTAGDIVASWNLVDYP
jgi:hypothetical protein